MWHYVCSFQSGYKGQDTSHEQSQQGQRPLTGLSLVSCHSVMEIPCAKLLAAKHKAGNH